MTDKIFTLLSAEPLVSIILGFLLAGFLAWVFRGVITMYIKKHYGLYSEEDIKTAMNDEMYKPFDKVPDFGFTDYDFTEGVLTNLKQNKNER